MQEIETIYEYIRTKYINYTYLTHNENNVVIELFENFEIRIEFNDSYNFYFNNYPYDNKKQDVIEVIDKIFSGYYVFCLKRNKIKMVDILKCRTNAYTHVWHINQPIK